jgi:hypothetical protein
VPENDLMSTYIAAVDRIEELERALRDLRQRAEVARGRGLLLNAYTVETIARDALDA